MTRAALVTGGTRGLGRGIAIALHDAGLKVGAVYYNREDAARAFEKETGIAIFCWDVSDFEQCRAGVASASAVIGEIDVLVNNAGITHDAVLHRMAPEQWQGVIATNLGSMFNMSRNVIEGIRARSFGRIINISSINGQKGQFGQTNYCAAKAGILGFTKALALENARKNITVNAIAPGYCNTDMVANIASDVMAQIVAQIPAGRLGNPDEIARMAAFLADERASFITGATFSVNGGQYMA